MLLILVGPGSGRSLMTGGRCSEVVVSTGLTVYEIGELKRGSVC